MWASRSNSLPTNAVERDQKSVVLDGAHSFKLSVQPHQIITVRLIAE
jgi:hypothetical protein